MAHVSWQRETRSLRAKQRSGGRFTVVFASRRLDRSGRGAAVSVVRGQARRRWAVVAGIVVLLSALPAIDSALPVSVPQVSAAQLRTRILDSASLPYAARLVSLGFGQPAADRGAGPLPGAVAEGGRPAAAGPRPAAAAGGGIARPDQRARAAPGGRHRGRRAAHHPR